MRSRARSVSRSTAPGPAPMKCTVTGPPRRRGFRRRLVHRPVRRPVLRGAPDRHRHRRAPAGEPTQRCRAGHLDPRQVPAVCGTTGDDERLGFQRDGVRHKPAARTQPGPAGVEHAWARDPATDEDGVRRRQLGQRVRRPSPDDLQRRHAQRLGVRDDPAGARLVALDGHRAAGPVGTQPLDRDRPVARPDVPQQLPRPRREEGEGDGADLPLGELPVVVVGVVGQARHLGADRRPGVGDARNGDDVQRVAWRVGPAACRCVHHALLAAAQAGEHAHRRPAVPRVDQQGGERARRRCVLAEHQQPCAGRQDATDTGERPGDDADDLDPVDGPPHPGARQGHRRGVRHDVQSVGAEHAGERGADAVEHRVAAGQHAHSARGQLGEKAGQRGEHGRWPGARFGLRVPGHQIELPGAADEHFRGADGARPGSASPAQPSAPTPTTVTMSTSTIVSHDAGPAHGYLGHVLPPRPDRLGGRRIPAAA